MDGRALATKHPGPAALVATGVLDAFCRADKRRLGAEVPRFSSSRRADVSPPVDDLLHFSFSAGSAVAVEERRHEPLSIVIAEKEQEKPADFEELHAWFARLDAGCTLGQVLQAAEQVAEGHAGHLEAAEENAYTEGILAADTRRC